MVRTVLIVLLVLALVMVGLPLAMMGTGASAPCPECDAVGGSIFLAMCAAILALAFALAISTAQRTLRIGTPSFIPLLLDSGLDRPPRAP